MTVYKFPIHTTDEQTIDMPQGAKVLCAKLQGDTLCLWALVSPRAPRERRTFLVRGTGHPIDVAEGYDVQYVDTFMMYDGGLVFHVFEVVLKTY